MTDRIEAKVHREGDWWVADMPTLNQVTQARTISSVEEAVREVASLVTGNPVDTFHVDMEIRVEGVPDFQVRAVEIKRTRQEAQQLERQAQEATRELANQLRAAGVSVRDAAEFLGVSHQRVRQLTK